MKRLLLVSHRAIGQAGGPAARWRSYARHLPAAGWEVDVVAAPEGAGAVEFARDASERRSAARRAQVMGAVGRLADPAFVLFGLRPEALPLSMAWMPRGARAVRARSARYDAVLATGPPMVALLAARAALRAGGPPLVVELRDLWAGNPAFDRGGPLLPALERWVFAGAAAIVGCTPEAADDLRRRHPTHANRVHWVPNGFEDDLLAQRRTDPPEGRPLTILHSGTLTADRPLAPLLRVLAARRDAFRLVLHGYVAPAIREEISGAAVPVEIVAASGWADAVARIAAADVTLVTQGHGAGDATAIASKVYEYLALGRPVLCLTDGGATEALLHRLGAGGLCARLGDPASIAAALDRLLDGGVPAPVAPERLEPYERARTARQLAAILDALA
ncbi:MAG TPA: glycosyltransferase [Solirubrobacteraceae bacterium]|nr:glycosyltransferase [Solirubrobacteraceae bacterium]